MSNVRPQFTRPANRPGALSSFTLTLPQPSIKRSFNTVENGFLSQLPSICFCCESAARLCRKENKFNTDHPLCYVRVVLDRKKRGRIFWLALVAYAVWPTIVL